MNEPGRALPVPPAALECDWCLELLRIWLVDGNQHIVVSPNMWSNPAAWGLLLVDIARHVASAYERQGQSRSEVLDLIRQAFEAEWANPTDAG